MFSIFQSRKHLDYFVVSITILLIPSNLVKSYVTNSLPKNNSSADTKLNGISAVTVPLVPYQLSPDYNDKHGLIQSTTLPTLPRTSAVKKAVIYPPDDTSESKNGKNRHNSGKELGRILLNSFGVAGLGLLYIQNIMGALNAPALIPFLLIPHILVTIATILIPIFESELSEPLASVFNATSNATPS